MFGRVCFGVVVLFCYSTNYNKSILVAKKYLGYNFLFRKKKCNFANSK